MTTDQCRHCGEAFEPGYDVCWNCGTHRDGTPPEEGFASDPGDADRMARADIACQRCNAPMHLVRRMRFHEGTRAWPFLLGDLGELFVNRETFDVYACAECGKVEFFLGARE